MNTDEVIDYQVDVLELLGLPSDTDFSDLQPPEPVDIGALMGLVAFSIEDVEPENWTLEVRPAVNRSAVNRPEEEEEEEEEEKPARSGPLHFSHWTLYDMSQWYKFN